MKILEALKTMKPLLKDSLANYAGLVAMSNGQLRAYDGVMSIKVAGSELTNGPDWACDGARLLSVLKEDSICSLAAEHLVVKTGRSIYKMRLLDPIEVPNLDHTGNMVEVEEADWRVLMLASRFRSPHAVYPWASCIYVRSRQAYVTNNIAACRFDINLSGEGMIPSEAVETIGLKNRPERMHIGERCAIFERGPISLRCAIPDASPPEVFFQRLEELGEAQAPLCEGLAEAIESAVIIDGRTVVINGDGVKAVSQRGDAVEVPIETGSSVEATFDPRYLLPVMTISDHIDWESYPKPVLFSGQGVRGILAGRR